MLRREDYIILLGAVVLGTGCSQEPTHCTSSAECFLGESCSAGSCVVGKQQPDMGAPLPKDLGMMPPPKTCDEPCKDGALCGECKVDECTVDDGCEDPSMRCENGACVRSEWSFDFASTEEDLYLKRSPDDAVWLSQPFYVSSNVKYRLNASLVLYVNGEDAQWLFEECLGQVYFALCSGDEGFEGTCEYKGEPVKLAGSQDGYSIVTWSSSGMSYLAGDEQFALSTKFECEEVWQRDSLEGILRFDSELYLSFSRPETQEERNFAFRVEYN